MKKLIAAALLVLAGCVHSTEISSSDTLIIQGSERQVSQFLADKRVIIGSTVTLVSDIRPRKGVRELRYSMSEWTPYREIGGLFYYAQIHGNKAKFERKKP